MSWPWPSARSASGRGCARRSALPELTADPRFATNGDRVEHRAVLRPILAERFLTRTTDAWVAELERAEIPVGAIRDVAAAFDSPEAAALGMAAEVEHPALGVLRQAGIPLRFSVDARAPSAARRHCSASTPTRSWPRSATTRRASPRCAATGWSD